MEQSCIKGQIMVIDELYQELSSLCGINENDDLNIANLVGNILGDFTKDKLNPAIWCMGEHTRRLTADYVFYLKNVRYIIDRNADINSDGYKIIRPSAIKAKDIDGIIISSYVCRNEIKDQIQREYPEVEYLDIYDELERNGICLDTEYYMVSHPYSLYGQINEINSSLDKSNQNYYNELKQLLILYIRIKDFRLAKEIAEEICGLKKSSENDRIAELVSNIYAEELRLSSSIDENNVLMLLCDGVRYEDVINGMPDVAEWMRKYTLSFSNTYSVSVGTFESLIPAFSEDYDIDSEFYKNSLVPSKNCRFIQEALSEHRSIYFYTDAEKYIDEPAIHNNGKWQTLTQKIWDFIHDSYEEGNGLYYLHELYESHFSFPNPYTKKQLVINGRTIFYDYMTDGGIKTDYEMQQNDAYRYINDTLKPFLDRWDFRILFLADHGHKIYPYGMPEKQIPYNDFSFADRLLRIPFAIKSPDLQVGIDDRLYSQHEFNNILVALEKGEQYQPARYNYVKSQRTAIYNPLWRGLCKRLGYEQELKAFERFTFDDGTILVIYGDGEMRCFGNNIEEKEMQEYLNLIHNDITVCDINKIRIINE